ncbi:hypothetical protein INT48_003037 [Thamnidium elegans]|uniref:Cytochrome P450 n=1 Tax=Thamnidium elegans TaxID=101142 RepID=A0A8H7VXK7_9FUNG|nr:hypothetical protein INT48_003037 [Thamnidium elegans]
MEYYTEFLKKVEKHERLIPILSAVAATTVTAYYVKRIISSSKKISNNGAEEIPVPDGAMYYLGHIPQMGSVPAHKITEWHKELGPILKVKMGVQDWVFISDPMIAQEIMATQGAITSGRPYLTFGNGISGKGGRGIVFADYNKNWKNARTAVLSILAPKSVAGFDKILQQEAENSINQLVEQTKLHGEVYPLSFIRLSSINIILATAFGLPGVSSPEDPFYKELVNMIETGIKFTSVVGDFSAYFPVLSFLDVIFRKERKMTDFVENVSHPMFRRMIKQALAGDQDSLVKKMHLIMEEYEIDERNLVVIMSEVLVAGSDTVAISASWTYAILCHYPEVQKKLADEVDAFINKYKRIPTFEDRLELPYYISVQKECLRYRPPVYFGVPRKASADGTVIVTNIHTLHNDSKTFYDADKFIPDRFIKDTRSMYASSNGNVQNRDQFVFGWGRRICPGIALAENELFNSITRVMARCRIEPALSENGDKIYPNLVDVNDGGSTVSPLPFKVRFVEREDRVILA